MSRGVYLSFLGIDGIGKSTLARTVARELEQRGATVRLISWRAYLDGEGQPAWPTETLQQLWLETFRLLYGGVKQEDAWLSLPRSYTEWRDEGWEKRLGELELSAADPSGPLAGALVETSGNIVFNGQVIQQILERGEFVIQETFPFKHTLKEVLIAKRLAAGNAEQMEAVVMVERFLRDLFASPLLHPDVGILLDGPAELAYRWRMSETGRLGLLEDYCTAGDRGMESFLALQRDTAEVFRVACQEWGWATHVVDDSGMVNNLRRGVALVLENPLVQQGLTRG